MKRRRVRIEGHSVDGILALSDAELDAFVFTGESVVFRAGTAELLGEIRRTESRLVLDLAQIDGGGKGVLPVLAALRCT